MNFSYIFIVVLLVGATILEAAPQNDVESNEPAFQLPVQLIGFPVIIMAVKMANFLKKLKYTLTPRTYQSRVRRGAIDSDLVRQHIAANPGSDLNVAEIEHQLVAEMGPDVCLFEDICQRYAAKTAGHHAPLDWEDVVKKYESYAGNRKKFYLLSVFLGDIVSSPKLCHQVATRPGRACK